MRAGWEVKKLGQVCQIELGRTPSRRNKSFWDTEKKTSNVWLSIRDISNCEGNIIFDSKEYVSDKGAELCKIVRKGTLLVSFKLTLGKLAFAGRDLFTNEAIAALNINNEKELTKAYLFHYLSFFDWDEAAAGDVKIKGKTLNKAKLKELKIIFPKSLEGQRRIVAVLDEALAGVQQAISHTGRNLQNAQDLFDSHLQSIFANPSDDWEEKTLQQISIDFGRGKSKHRPRNHPKLYGGDYPFIQTGDIRNCNHLITDYSQTYNEVGLAQSKLWPKGTICITIAANIAETGILSFDACFPDSVIGVVVNPSLATSGFVEYLLQSFKVKLQAKGKGSAQDNINMGTFKNEYFPFPSVDKQRAIVTQLDNLAVETQRLQTIYQQKLNTLHELKQSILQQAFSGNLKTSEVFKTSEV